MRRLLVGLCVLGLAVGCRHRVVVVETAAPVQPVQGDSDEAEEDAESEADPPPDVVETQPPPPSATHVWIVGRHRWVGGRWVWTGGRWVVGRPGHTYVPGHWEHRGPRHMKWVPGRWHR